MHARVQSGSFSPILVMFRAVFGQDEPDLGLVGLARAVPGPLACGFALRAQLPHPGADAAAAAAAAGPVAGHSLQRVFAAIWPH